MSDAKEDAVTKALAGVKDTTDTVNELSREQSAITNRLNDARKSQSIAVSQLATALKGGMERQQFENLVFALKGDK